MRITALSWRLLSAGGRRGALGSVLTLAAVTVSTALLLFAIAANHAFDARGDRTAWRLPDAADSGATAIEASDVDHIGDQTFMRVDLAATGDGTPPVPPGMDHFPAPGEVWLSPALADLAESLPDAQLADRFGSEASGELGDAALTHSAELVAVVGHAEDDPVMTAYRGGYNAHQPTPIAGFAGEVPIDQYVVYRALTVLATILMVVPLLVFGGAAARLTVARRDQRLATLRLVGATPGQVVGVTVVEAVITAAVGAVLGTALYAAAIPAIARIPIDGHGWYLADLWPPLLWTAGVIVAIPFLVGLSAIIGLRRIVVSPLGVARRHTPPGLRAVRLLVLFACIIGFGVVSSGMFGELNGFAVVLVLVLLTGTFLSMNYVGPWVVSLLGRITAATARSASTLLAGRRLVDDPRSAWRTVAGVALTGFVAGFMALLSPTSINAPHPDTVLAVTTSSETADDVAERAAELVPDDGTVDDPKTFVDLNGEKVDDVSRITISIPGRDADVDRLRTELGALTPGNPVELADDMDVDSNRSFADIRTGVLVVLSVSVLIAMVSAAVSGTSSVLDRRQTYGLLHLSGMPMRTLNAARRAETLIPLTVMGGGSVAVGVVMASPFLSELGMNPTGLAIMAVTLIGGTAGVLGASAVSRPLLKSVMLNASPRPD